MYQFFLTKTGKTWSRRWNEISNQSYGQYGTNIPYPNLPSHGKCKPYNSFHDSKYEPPGPWFNIKMSSYQYGKSHFGDKTVVRSSYLHNGFSILVRWHLYIEPTPKICGPYLAELILVLRPANERWCYFVTASLIGWAQTYNQPYLTVNSQWGALIYCIDKIWWNVVGDRPGSSWNPLWTSDWF